LLEPIAVFLSAIGYSLNVIIHAPGIGRRAIPLCANHPIFQTVGPALILALPAAVGWRTPTLPDLLQFAVSGHNRVNPPHTMFWRRPLTRVEAARLAPVGNVTAGSGVLFGFLSFRRACGLADVGRHRAHYRRHLLRATTLKARARANRPRATTAALALRGAGAKKKMRLPATAHQQARERPRILPSCACGDGLNIFVEPPPH
jgi:hypothetical protein